MAIDTFGDFGIVDITDDVEPADRTARLIKDDAALRPWLVGPAIWSFRYTTWERVQFVVRSAWEAGMSAWRLSR